MADPPRKPGSRERVRAYLEARGLADGLTEFEQPTKTAAQAAEVMGCELGQIVKSLVVVADAIPVVALVAGDRRADLDAVASELGAAEAQMADADTVRAATGYAIGGVSPFDLPEGLMVLIDESFARFDVVFPAAGTPSSMVRVSMADLIDVTGGRVARISH